MGMVDRSLCPFGTTRAGREGPPAYVCDHDRRSYWLVILTKASQAGEAHETECEDFS